MSAHTSNEHSIAPKMASPTETSLVDKKVVISATSEEVTPKTRRKEESTIINSLAKTQSYRHALPVVEVVELVKRLDLHGPAGPNMVNSAKDNEELEKKHKHATTPVDTDTSKCAQDGEVLAPDSESIGSQQAEVAVAPHNGSSTEESIRTDLSTYSAKSSTETANASEDTGIASTEPVPHIYLPRRRNIFSKRAPQRNVGWSPEVLATITASAAEDFEKDGDEFTTEELREFQSETAKQMENKTEKFLSMASKYSWRPRVVEDLGEIFEIEEE